MKNRESLRTTYTGICQSRFPGGETACTVAAVEMARALHIDRVPPRTNWVHVLNRLLENSVRKYHEIIEALPNVPDSGFLDCEHVLSYHRNHPFLIGMSCTHHVFTPHTPFHGGLVVPCADAMTYMAFPPGDESQELAITSVVTAAGHSVCFCHSKSLGYCFYNPCGSRMVLDCGEDEFRTLVHHYTGAHHPQCDVCVFRVQR
jgi:hypothetical protein